MVNYLSKEIVLHKNSYIQNHSCTKTFTYKIYTPKHLYTQLFLHIVYT